MVNFLTTKHRTAINTHTSEYATHTVTACLRNENFQDIQLSAILVLRANQLSDDVEQGECAGPSVKAGTGRCCC